MKSGTKITVRWVRPEGDVSEQAVIARTTKSMLPLPPDYLPVRFADGALLLVHRERIIY